MFNLRKTKNFNYFRRSKPTHSVLSVMSFRPVSPPPNISLPDDQSSSSTFLSINHLDHIVRQDDYQPRRRLSSTSSIIKGKSAGLLSSSTSSLVGDMVLKSEDVIRLKENLRKTGLVDKNQTLRRKLPTESIQMDFRSVLRPKKNNLITTNNK